MDSGLQSKTAIASELASIVGENSLVSFENLDGPQQQRIRAALRPNSPAPDVVFPKTQAELAAVIACTHRHQWRSLICGQGSKLSWGELAQDIDVVISTQRSNRIIEHDPKDLTVTVEAGVPLATLQTSLAPHQQFVALDPAYPDQATLGGIIATQDAGAWRHRYGGVRDMVLGITFVRADGQMAKAGGRVVKNVAGYDLMKLLTGSFGTLGVISQVTLRLYPLPPASSTSVLTGSAAAIAQATQTLLRGTITPTALDLLSPQLGADCQLSGALGLAVRVQSLPESVKVQCDRLGELARALDLVETRFTGAEESEFWAQIQHRLWRSHLSDQTAVTCKIGVLPSTAVPTLTTMAKGLGDRSPLWGRIHASSGLGVIRLEGGISPEQIRELRSHCQENQGFLTVLEAPVELKQQVDIWGYSGNALESMRQLKARFDPQQLLNPGRFVGGI